MPKFIVESLDGVAAFCDVAAWQGKGRQAMSQKRRKNLVLDGDIFAFLRWMVSQGLSHKDGRMF
jgi:hypothetical protein